MDAKKTTSRGWWWWTPDQPRRWMIFGFAAAVVTTASFFATLRVSSRWLNQIPNAQTSNTNLDITPLAKLQNRLCGSGKISNKYLTNSQLNYKEPKFLYLGNVPIEHRLQQSIYETSNQYWDYYSNAAMPLAIRTLILSTIFSTSICIAFIGTFCWYFNIESAKDVIKLFENWSKPLKQYMKIEYELTEYDKQIDEETKNMSLFEFLTDLTRNYEHYNKLNQKSWKKQKEFKTDNKKEK